MPGWVGPFLVFSGMALTIASAVLAAKGAFRATPITPSYSAKFRDLVRVLENALSPLGELAAHLKQNLETYGQMSGRASDGPLLLAKLTNAANGLGGVGSRLLSFLDFVGEEEERGYSRLWTALGAAAVLLAIICQLAAYFVYAH